MAVPVRLSLYTSQPTATPSQLRSWRLTGQDKPRFARPAQEPAHPSTGVPANVGPGAAGGFAHASPQGQEAPRGREEWLPQAQAHPGGWQYRLQVPRGAKMHVDLVGKTLRVTADTRVGGEVHTRVHGVVLGASDSGTKQCASLSVVFVSSLGLLLAPTIGKDGGKGQQSSLAWELPAGADPRHVQALMKVCSVTCVSQCRIPVPDQITTLHHFSPYPLDAQGNILGIWVRRLP